MQTAFIFSAGNTESEIREGDDLDFKALRQPNVLVVAAISESGRSLDEYSSWHSEIVRLATPGHVDLADGRRFYGTSFSAPRAAVLVQHAFDKNLDLTGSQAIDEVLALAKTNTFLEARVKQGRFFCEKVLNP